jgi:Flp pilus assembly protein TadD
MVVRAWVWVMLGALAAVPSVEAQTAPEQYLVVPFENATGEPRVYWLTEGSAVILTDDVIALGETAIARDDRLRAFDRLRVPPISTLSHATVIRLGQIVGAAHVVVGVFELQGDELVVRARAIRLDTGQISPELVERGPLGELLAVYGRIARRIVPDSPVSAEQMERGQPPLAAVENLIKGLLAEMPDTQIAYLTQALRMFPNLQRARVALWYIHSDASEHLAALAIIRQVPPGHRLTRQARFLEALSFLHLGQYQESFNTFAELQREGPDPTLLNNLGIVQLRRPDGAPGGSAVSYLTGAIDADPADPDLFFNLGYAYWLDKDLPSAISWLREAVRRNPADDAAHYLLGVALQASGSAAEAAREKDLARRLSSTYEEWEATQPGANAVPDGLERLKTEIDVPASLRVESAVVAAGQSDQRAIAAFHLQSGRRLFEEGRDLDAIAELRRTVFLSPYETEAHLLLGRVYLRLGRQQEAVDALKIAVWSDPANGEAQALLDSLP